MAIAISTSTGIPVIAAVELGDWAREIPRAMKNLKRLVFGALSSLLFTIGFARAADQLDPMSQSLPQVNTDSAISGAPDCTTLCDIHDSKL
jgi:hypothetical protein